MRVEPLAIPDVMLLHPTVHGDERGFFLERFNQRTFEKATGLTRQFVQDNHSRSAQSVLRGLHYQIQQPQGKLVSVLQGEILDVAVDIRPDSPTRGQWVSAILSGDNFQQLWVPEGFAHGFLVLSQQADVLYKTTDYYAPEHERVIRWDDPALGIDWMRSDWPWTGEPQLSEKDQRGTTLQMAEPPIMDEGPTL